MDNGLGAAKNAALSVGAIVNGVVGAGQVAQNIASPYLEADKIQSIVRESSALDEQDARDAVLNELESYQQGELVDQLGDNHEDTVMDEAERHEAELDAATVSENEPEIAFDVDPGALEAGIDPGAMEMGGMDTGGGPDMGMGAF